MRLNINKEWLIDVNDLELIELLNSHEHVKIYKAYWRKYQTVCVKRIELTPENKKMVDREIDILSKCVHPKICQYLGSGVSEKNVYMLFEYMEQGDLQQYVASNILTHAQKIDILRSILIGMNYLSARTPEKILHRDFKPTNVLVNRHGEVKICDFGVSKQMFHNNNNGLQIYSESKHHRHEHTTTDMSHTGIGTIRWAAPELLIDDGAYDETCDIYSFGLLAFFVVTNGIVPYQEEYGNNLAQIGYAKAMNKRPFLQHTELSSNLHRMITECTEKDPALRPQKANTILCEYF